MHPAATRRTAMKRTKVERTGPPPELKAPKSASTSFGRFHAEHEKLLQFFRGTTTMAVEAAARSTLATRSSGDPLSFLGKNLALMNNLLFGRGVDNFLTYVSEILYEVFLRRPEILKTSQRETTVAEVLEHATRADFIAFVAEDLVRELAYKGLANLNKFVGKKLKVPLVEKDTDLETLVRIVEDRNLIAHNRGVVNKLYLHRVAKPRHLLSRRLPFHTHETVEDYVFLHDVAADFDARVRAKFRLRKQRKPR